MRPALAGVLLWSTLAFGHGGEDHTPAAPVVDPDGERITTWSSEFDVVVELPAAADGERIDARLFLADAGTSAPVGTGTAKVRFEGPAPVEVAVEAPAAGPAGIWPFHVELHGAGPWSGGLQVISGDRADALGFAPFLRAHDHEPVGLPWGWIAAGLGLGGVLVGMMIGGGAGAVVGRYARIGGAGLLVVGLASVGREVQAHGGEDHGVGAAPASADPSGLFLPMESQFLMGLRTERARKGPWQDEVRAFGNAVAAPGGGAEIHAPVRGIVSFAPGFALTPGQYVEAGAPLASIVESLGGADRNSVLGGRTDALVRLAEARRRLDLAKRDWDRAGELAGVLSDREKLERQKALELAQEEVRQLQGSASQLGRASPEVELRAPISGRVSAMLARPGDVVAEGEVLLRMVREGAAWAELRVPEALAGRLVVGGKATVVADARPGETLAATILDPGLEADPRTGTLAVTLSIDEADWLIPGMTLTGRLASGPSREVLAVADQAVIDSGGETLVFVKTGPERFAMRTVRTGGQAGGRREILSGIEPGERVVTEGTYALRSLAGR